MKSKFFLSSGVFALFIFLASPMLLASDVSYSRPDPLMDYVSQETGFYDTVYWELDEGYCRNCHGSNLAEQHHMTDTAIHGFCTPCHWVGESGGLVISDCLTGNCHSWNDLDTNGSHHNTEDAATGNCIACHDETVIGEFGPGVSFEEDLPPPDMNLPTPFSCENCHWGQAVTGSGHPSTHDHIDEGLASYYEYGRGIHNTFETHHMASVGNIEFNCHMCHGFGFDPDTAVMNWDPCNPEIIRSCERCHTTDTLHNIHLPDLYGWEAVGFHVDDKPGNEP